MSTHHRFTATVSIDVEADTPTDARRAAFSLMTSATLASKRGRAATAQPRASVTGVTIESHAVPIPAGWVASPASQTTADVLE